MKGGSTMKTKVWMLAALFFAAGFLLSVNARAADPEMVIDFDVTSKAQVTQVLMVNGKWGGQPAVMVKAKIKNMSDQPIQFKVTCDFVGTDISRGFMVPKVGNPLLEPGKSGTATFPFPFNEIPKKLILKVVDFTLED
jgi:hypothetical protein